MPAQVGIESDLEKLRQPERDGWYNLTQVNHSCSEFRVVESERNVSAGRVCPWCDSTEVRFVQRGYVGPTDEVDQYLVCAACTKTTYEIIAKTAREMRLGRYKPGSVYQDRPQNTRYTISRVLRAGQNEFLLYLKPLAERAGAIL